MENRNTGPFLMFTAANRLQKGVVIFIAEITAVLILVFKSFTLCILDVYFNSIIL